METNHNINEEPGQGHTREQYRFAATMVAACAFGIAMIAAFVGLVKLLKYFL